MTCTVTATRVQLESVGCSQDLTDKEVEHVKDYHTGYSEVKFLRKDLTELLGKSIYETYDIPKHWLKFTD